MRTVSVTPIPALLRRDALVMALTTPVGIACLWPLEPTARWIFLAWTLLTWGYVLKCVRRANDPRPILTLDDGGIELFEPSCGRVAWADVRSVEFGQVSRTGSSMLLYVARRAPITVWFYRVSPGTLEVIDMIQQELDRRFRGLPTVPVSVAVPPPERPVPSLRNPGWVRVLPLILFCTVIGGIAIQLFDPADTLHPVLSVEVLAAVLLLMVLAVRFTDVVEVTQDAVVRRRPGRTTRIFWGHATIRLDGRIVEVRSGTDSIRIPAEQYADRAELVSWIRERIEHETERRAPLRLPECPVASSPPTTTSSSLRS